MREDEGLIAGFRALGPGVEALLTWVEALVSRPWECQVCQDDAAFLHRSGERLRSLYQQLLARVEDSTVGEIDASRLRHDLRGQLSATIGSAQLLLEAADDEGEDTGDAPEVLRVLAIEGDRLVAELTTLGTTLAN